MSENNVVSNDLFGRLDIYATSDVITAENVVEELNTALPYHVQNLLQEDFLYWYRRNVQPFLKQQNSSAWFSCTTFMISGRTSFVLFRIGCTLRLYQYRKSSWRRF